MNCEVMFGSKSDEWERFFNNISKKADCWEWKACLDKDGYGVYSSEGKTVRAHRYIMSKLLGTDIPKELCVCHICDNRKCVNPDHLFIATNRANTIDRNNKNRQAKGEKQGFAKLTEKDVKNMRKLYFEDGVSFRKIAQKYNICYSTAREAITETGWKHVK
jgi:hypothetical protein